MKRYFSRQSGTRIYRTRNTWLEALRIYILTISVSNLVWEFAHLPLYEFWQTASPRELAFAALHCTGGDILIGSSSIMIALLVVGENRWPARGHRRVFYLTLLIGFFYTVFSEWLNIEVRQAWAYSELMPVIPVLNMGLSPALQWVLIPALAYRLALGRRNQL